MVWGGRWSTAVCGVALAACLAGSAAVAGEGIAWMRPRWQEASRRARAEGKLVFVFVRSDTCPWCDFFEKNYGRDPAFVAWANELFVNVRANVGETEGAALVEQLGLREAAVPRFYLLTPDGRVLGREEGVKREIPFQALSLVRGAEDAAGAALPRDRLISLAKRLKTYKDTAKKDRAALYAAMEAMAWHWAGSRQNAQAAFGAPWKDHLESPAAREWYVYFWAGLLRDNLAAALDVAEENANQDATFLRYAAIIHSWRRDYRAAVRYGEAYLRADPGDAAFARAVENWRNSR